MECFNEPLNLCIKNATGREPSSRDTTIDYDEAVLASQAKNCDRPTTTMDDGDEPTECEPQFNPNLLLQQHQLEQYLLLQQQQQQTHQQLVEGTMAKMHLDKYLKLTNRYLHTMSPFLQHFTPVGANAQAAATAAATLLLNNPVNEDDGGGGDSPKTPDSCDGSAATALMTQSNDSVRFFLHKLIEHNFIQQLQQQQQLNDLINNNNNNNNNQSNGKMTTTATNNNSPQVATNGHNHKKSPAHSNDGDSDFYNQHMLQTPTNAKTFFDFLKSAASNVANAGGGNNNNNNSSSSNNTQVTHNSRIQQQQGYNKR